MRVIAKAYGDRPLDRVVVDRANHLVYVAREDVARHIADDPDAGVGFPPDCIFTFDPELYESLVGAWTAKDRTALEALWSKASPAGGETLRAA